MEVSALKHSGLAGLRGPLPLLRLQSDERLVALARRGHQSAFEALVGRYQTRLLGFCRHMLGSREDAEDVLQEVFAASFNAMLADEREINVRPWLYRIARNRCLNHLRKQTAIGQDSMDMHYAENGLSTGEKALAREDLRELLRDVGQLPETQRTALLLREIDALSYEQIAEAMETTVPSVKSLLVRARVGLAEMAESRRLTCDEVRFELGEVAEGLARTSPPVRRHLKSCDRCREFRVQLKDTNRALAALYPVGPLLFLKKIAITKLGLGGAGGAHVASGAGATATAATATAAVGGGGGAAGLITAGAGAVAAKAVVGFAAAALVTAGAVEMDGSARTRAAHRHAAAVASVSVVHAAAAPAAFVPRALVQRSQPVSQPAVRRHRARKHLKAKPRKATVTPTTVATTTAATTPAAPVTAPPKPPVTQVQTDTTVLPTTTTTPTPPPGVTTPTPVATTPTPVVSPPSTPPTTTPTVPVATDPTPPVGTTPTGDTPPPPTPTPTPATPVPAPGPLSTTIAS